MVKRKLYGFSIWGKKLTREDGLEPTSRVMKFHGPPGPIVAVVLNGNSRGGSAAVALVTKTKEASSMAHSAQAVCRNIMEEVRKSKATIRKPDVNINEMERREKTRKRRAADAMYISKAIYLGHGRNDAHNAACNQPPKTAMSNALVKVESGTHTRYARKYDSVVVASFRYIAELVQRVSYACQPADKLLPSRPLRIFQRPCFGPVQG